jgi:hypothetical protein
LAERRFPADGADRSSWTCLHASQVKLPVPIPGRCPPNERARIPN